MGSFTEGLNVLPRIYFYSSYRFRRNSIFCTSVI